MEPCQKDLERFVQKDSKYYISSWGKHQDHFFKGWNWSAAFFGFRWMLYRKMVPEYFIGIFIWAFFYNLLSTALKGSGVPYGTIRYIRLLSWTLSHGLLANKLYLSKAKRILCKADSLTGKERKRWIKGKGGVKTLWGLLSFTTDILLLLIRLLYTVVRSSNPQSLL